MMLILSPVLIFIIFAIVLSLISWLRPKASYIWLIAALGALLSWISIWVLRSEIGNTITLLDWEKTGLFDFSLKLFLDEISWTFALILSTLVFAVILTDVSRASETDSSSWIGSMLISALGILAVLGENIETILFLWVVIDILDLIVILLRVRGYEKQQGVILYFSTSFFGTMLIIFAGVISYSQNIHLTFENISPEINLILIFAVGLRLGVFPLQAPFLKDPAQQRGLGSIIKLIQPAASLLLLVRIAEVGVPTALIPYLLLLSGMAAIYGAIAWARSKDEIRGRRYWILSLASFAIASAILAKSQAVFTWSQLLIYSGALIFLASAHTRSRIIIVLIGIFSISSLPFSASQGASSLFSAPFNILLIPFVISHAILISGYFRHATTSGKDISGVEPWVKAVYPLGLALILITHWLTGTIFSFNIEMANHNPIVWSGIVALILTSLIIYFSARKISFPSIVFSSLDNIFSLAWFYKLSNKTFNVLSLGLNFFTNLIEGRGGVLWAILLVTLILTLSFQNGIS